jgi:hypothetical protein
VPQARSASQPISLPDDEPSVGGRRWLVLLETWGLSVLFHVSLIVILGLSWRAATKPAGDAPEILRTVELVAKRDTPEGPVYVDKASQDQATAEASNPAPPNIKQMLGGGGMPSPIDLSPSLPKSSDVAGLGIGSGPPMLGGGNLLDGPTARTSSSSGRARTKVYGLKGEGHRFVYVFDRSGSMGGSGNKALNSAKKELLQSIADLGDTHQFQIIFYNEQPTIMRFDNLPNLMFANAENKARARLFVAGISADGATAHEPAIYMALQLNPDVIFFLTDADQPELSPATLQKIQQRNHGACVINTIEFGLGPKIRKENFLDRLAAQNGGGSVYVDINSRTSP